ncbi:MAG: ABC transporter permease [Halobacteriota archaeon]
MSTKTGSTFGTGSMLNGWFGRNKNTILVGILLIVVWQLFADFVVQSNLYLPSPWFSLQETIDARDVVLQGLRTTVIEIVSGFIFGMTIGIGLGILTAESYLMRRVGMPWVVFIYSIPAAIVAPLFLVWFGINLFAIALFVSMLSFFPVYVSTLTGFTSIEEEYYNLGEISGASRWQMAKNIKIWVALPHMFAGIRIAVKSSVVGAIVAEFIASGSGLGFLIVSMYEQLQIGVVFGTVFLLMFVAILAYQIVNFLLETLRPGPKNAV